MRKKILQHIKKILFTFTLLILLTCLVLEIGYVISWNTAETGIPNYDKVNISTILEKGDITNDEYKLLYKQTGLTKIGVERALNQGQDGLIKIMEIQNNYFNKHPK